MSNLQLKTKQIGDNSKKNRVKEIRQTDGWTGGQINKIAF